MVVHTYNSSSQETQAGGDEFEASLSYIEKPYFKKRKMSHLRKL
jgi:hypothetical protein